MERMLAPGGGSGRLKVRLGRVYVDGVSGQPERIRLCGEVYWGRARRRAEIYWFEFPAALEPELSRSWSKPV
jgi:hypothetical protein